MPQAKVMRQFWTRSSSEGSCRRIQERYSYEPQQQSGYLGPIIKGRRRRRIVTGNRDKWSSTARKNDRFKLLLDSTDPFLPISDSPVQAHWFTSISNIYFFIF